MMWNKETTFFLDGLNIKKKMKLKNRKIEVEQSVQCKTKRVYEEVDWTE